MLDDYQSCRRCGGIHFVADGRMEAHLAQGCKLPCPGGGDRRGNLERQHAGRGCRCPARGAGATKLNANLATVISASLRLAQLVTDIAGMDPLLNGKCMFCSGVICHSATCLWWRAAQEV